MKKLTNQLKIKQLDRKLVQLGKLDENLVPGKGWIYSIRTTLNMSLRQLGKKLSITPQSVKEIETREENKSITLKNLSDTASVLNMRLVYGFVPLDGSLEKMIEKKAYEIAQQIVMRTSHSMGLEDQENRPQRIKAAIKERAEEIKKELPKYLWD